ncbi:MAG: ribosome recycling factor [Bacteroidota bacterium]|nr:ribosome recycling factor [Bacteroidota bacterium]
MAEDVKSALANAEAEMKKAIEHVDIEFNKVRAGKASPSMLDGIRVDYYGNSTPLAQVGTINTPDAKTLIIQPWEKNVLIQIEKAIVNSNLGLNPQNDGVVIRITLPPLTEERRKQLVKQVKEASENGKVAVRKIRQDTNESIKKLVKAGTPEDEGKGAETKVQELTDKFITQVDDLYKSKEKEVLTV